MKFLTKPLVPDTWQDLETLFGPTGACGGCWCMTMRSTCKEYNLNKGMGNKNGLYALVQSGQPTGIIAYDSTRPVGWCSVAPREQFIRLKQSRMFKPVDSQPAWLLNCFYIHRAYRRRGVSSLLIKEATAFASANGAKVVEAYPYSKHTNIPDVFAYAGLARSFEKNGFKEVAFPSRWRVIMRFCINASNDKI